MNTGTGISITILLFLLGAGLGYWLGGDGAAPPPTSATSDVHRAADDTSSGPWDASLGARPRFVEVSAAAGIHFLHVNDHHPGKPRYPEIMGSGVALFDYDDDGDLDVYLLNGNRLFAEASPEITNRLYRNDGDWRFVDVTVASGLGDTGYGQGVCAADYDDDGDLDVYVTNFGPNALYQNQGGGRFVDVAERAGVRDEGWGQSCSFFDYDADGDLDLYTQNYMTYDPAIDKAESSLDGKSNLPDYSSPLTFRGATNRLFRNEGSGTFRDVTQESGVFEPEGKGMGLAVVDFDGDGREDVFVANDSMENYLFVNLGGGKFAERGMESGVAFSGSGVPEASMGVDAADYDGDGRIDLIVPCLQRQVFTLYQNTDLGFVDVSVAAGLAPITSKATGFNANFFDYDDDGDLDIYFTNGGVRRNEDATAEATYVELYGIRDALATSNGKGRYLDATPFAGDWFREARIGRGSATGDLDGDGDLDLVVTNLADRVAVLRNDTEGGHWVTLDLRGANGRRNPQGTRIALTAGGRTQHVALHGGVTFLSQSDRRPHFGLGAATAIERIEIRWPGRKEPQVLEGVEVDRVTRIAEGAR